MIRPLPSCRIHWRGCQTSDSSFSVVWTATIASKDAFFCIFRDLQDLHSFAPLQSQILQIFRKLFRENFRIFSDFCKILLNFCEISAKINKILTQICKLSEIRMVQKDANLIGTFGFVFFSLQGLRKGSRPPTDPKMPFPHWKID